MERVCEQFINRLKKPVVSVKMKNGLIFRYNKEQQKWDLYRKCSAHTASMS